MKKTNKLISILIAVAMLLSMAPISVFAASVVASGKFGASGSNLTWSLDSDGVLTISGSGAMEDFANVSKVPWYSKRTNVKTVVIESGVTNIGKDAFYGISSLVNATISDTVTSIGNRAFSGSGLTNFEFSDAGNLKTIGNSAFNSTKIKSMIIPDGVTTLGSYVFGYGPIKSVTIPASVTSIGNYFFEETSSLNEVIFLGNKEPETIGDTVFLACSSLAYVSVPADYEGDTFSNMRVSKAAASVAEVNGQGFATLADAISAAQSISGAELKLLSHISIDSGITIESGNFTIDLNGKELFSNGYFLLRIDGADVTIVDSAGGGIFNATNDQGNIVLEVLSGSANISGGTFNSAGYPATVRDGTLKLTGKDFVLNGNWRIGWYGGSVDLSACTADEVRIQACADGLQASAVTLPDGWGLFKTNGTPCIDFVKNDIYVAKAGFKVTASINPAEGGTVEGAGTYSAGATVNLTASAANGYRFVNWIENGEEVSTSAVYTFTASENRELTANFEIVPHTHSFTYSASGDTITAVCENTDGNCPDPEGTLTILAPADLYADGITAKEATIENNLVDTSVAISDITYSAPYGLPPKDAGTYTASVTVGGATVSVEFTLLNYAAKVTDKDGNELEGSPYKTLADAITAAQGSEGSTVTLLDDVTLKELFEINSGKITLDLNGKTISASDGIAVYADLTVFDSATGGKIYGDTFGLLNSGLLTIKGGVINASCAIYNYGTVNVIDGDIQGKITNNGKVTVNGGTLTYINNVNTSHEAVIEINDGIFTSSNTIVNSDGEIIVKGGKYPNGFSVTNDGISNCTLNTILAEDYYYKDADGKLIDVADDAKIINGYVKVSKGADLSDAVITVDKTEFVYNGQHQAPAVTVTIGGKTLKENVDYAVNARRWENGVPVQWFYYVDAGVYTSVIDGLGDYTGKVEKEFVIKPATVDIIWEGDSFYYTGNPHKVTAKYIDVNGDENPAAITQNKTNTEIGKYIATATVEDSNYTVNGATINHAYEIKWYDGAPDATVSGTKGENGWYTSAVTVTAPEGYTISTAVDGTYGNTITFVENEENAVYYLKQTENGYIAKVELGEIKYDLADPAAEITMAENKWNSFLNTVTFGYFFKETQSITITASDETSGIAKIEYVVATEEITDFENAEWIEYTEKFNIEPNSKNIIYAKATDKAGRYVIVNSDGIVVYSDSQVTTADTLTYTLTTIEDVEYSVDFKGNTVDYVRINNDELSTDEYEATEKSVIIKGEYIENLAADAVYEIVIGINPMGETYADGDAPAEMKAYLAVEKITGSVIIINDISKVYDGTPVEAPQYETIGTGEVTIKYTSAIGEPQYTDVVPTQAGTYFVLVEIAETNKSTYDFGVAEFTIAKADSAITAAPTPNTLTYNGEAHNLISAGEAMYGTMVYSLDGTEYSETIPQGTDAGDYTVYYKVIGDANHNDTEPATVIVTIKAKDISDGFIILGAPLTYNGKEQTQTVEKVLPTGTAPEATYTVSGNKATNVGVYLLTVTGTGNFTGEAKIAYEIALDVECISHLDRVEDNGVMKWNVKSTDRESLEYVIDQLNNAVTDIADEDKKNEWADTKEACEDMLRIINSIELAIADVEEDYAGFSEDTVKSSDIPALDEIVSKVNEIKDRYGFNLTDEEAKKLEDILDGIEKLKAKIAETAEEIERIDEAVNGYDEETVTSDDIPELVKLIEDIKALTDGDNLTEDEKAALEEADKAIDELVEKLTEVAEEIKRVDEAVKSYDEETVKSTDSDELSQLKEDVQNLIDSDNTTENEKTALEEMIKDIEGLEDKITETEEKLEEIAGIENVYNPEKVTSDDKVAIQKTIDEIEAVNPDNLTEEQREEYEEIKAGFEALLEEIASAEKDVADIGAELETFDEERVTKFWEDDIEALKAKLDELLADENMGETEKAKLNEYKAQAEKLIEIINTPVEYFSLRFFYLIWDCLTWKWNGLNKLFESLFGIKAA